MTRATGTPVPVMAETSTNTEGLTDAKGARATKGAAAKTDAASKTDAARDNVEYLGGPWGASFIGKGPDGKAVKGLTWARRHTRKDIHPYDELEWELRTAAISS